MIMYYPQISIVFAANNNYIPYVYCSLMSLLAHQKTTCTYHIYLLHTDVTTENQNFLKGLQTPTLQVTFVDCCKMKTQLDKLSLSLTYHFTIETYYRLFLAELFPQLDKVLYLDADTLICHDIADLWNIELEDYYLAATRDLEIIRVSTIGKVEEVSYLKDVLNLQELHWYFQAGVMCVNLKKWREDNLQQKLLTSLARIKNPLYVDQDILNNVCQGHVKFISQNWNYTWHLPFIDKEYIHTLPKLYAEQYQAAQKDPYIVHFTGENMKPTDIPGVPQAQLFWKYATASPFFNTLWQDLLAHQREAFRFAQQNKFTLWRYRVLKNCLWGRKRQYYLRKYNMLWQKIYRYL